MEYKHFKTNYNTVFDVNSIQDSDLQSKLFKVLLEKIKTSNYDRINNKIYVPFDITTNDYDFMDDLRKLIPNSILARDTHIAFTL